MGDIVEIQEGTISDLVNELRARRWSDASIGKELGVAGVTVFRWRCGQRGEKRVSPLVRRALLELLERS